jgi:hypothetical protein
MYSINTKYIFFIKFSFEGIQNFIWEIREIAPNFEQKAPQNYAKLLDRKIKTTFE